MSDWTDEEYSRMINGAAGHRDEELMVAADKSQTALLDTTSLDDNVDWRKQGAVSPPKVQG